MSQQFIGQCFLNISFALYLVLYLPQLIHNAKFKTFNHMSKFMHFMILQAYVCDLFYGLSKGMPWQYITVSSIGTIYLFIQHVQWMLFNKQQHLKNHLFYIAGSVLCVWPMLLWYFFPENHTQIHFQAWLSRILFILHFLPQIIKNYRREDMADSISPNYLILSFSLTVTDLISAWCLKWDTANLTGSMIGLMLKTFLAYQIWVSLKSKPKLSFLNTRSAL